MGAPLRCAHGLLCILGPCVPLSWPLLFQLLLPLPQRRQRRRWQQILLCLLHSPLAGAWQQSHRCLRWQLAAGSVSSQHKPAVRGAPEWSETLPWRCSSCCCGQCLLVSPSACCSAAVGCNAGSSSCCRKPLGPLGPAAASPAGRLHTCCAAAPAAGSWGLGSPGCCLVGVASARRVTSACSSASLCRRSACCLCGRSKGGKCGCKPLPSLVPVISATVSSATAASWPSAAAIWPRRISREVTGKTKVTAAQLMAMPIPVSAARHRPCGQAARGAGLKSRTARLSGAQMRECRWALRARNSPGLAAWLTTSCFAGLLPLALRLVPCSVQAILG